MTWPGAALDPGGATGATEARTAPPTGDRESGAQRDLVGRVLRCYPVTVVVLAPYALLILPTAVFYRNPETGFIVSLVGLALLGSVAVETIGRLSGRPDPRWREGFRRAHARYPWLYPVAVVVTLTSVTANVLGAHLGRGTIVNQVSGDLSDGPLAMVSTLFSGWTALGFALLLASHLGGRLPRAKLYGWLAVLVGAEIYVAVLTALTAPLVALVFFMAATGALCGVFRLRYLVVCAVVLFLAWPAVFEHRNALREDRGVAVDTKVTATDRLRLDSQLSVVAGFDVPVDLGQPGVTDYLRYGLVPRVLDPDRPVLSTGQRINQYIGGGPTSAYTFLLLGNIWFFDGAVGVVAVHAFWAALAAVLLRWRGPPGPIRLSLFCLVLFDPLLWSNTYPDSTIGFLQHVVAATPVFVLLGLSRRSLHGARKNPDTPRLPTVPGAPR
ncbi:hypothetical protein NIE79_003192 [Micromonospora sp. NIE79]|uniref:Oligosaccharide repeat unit polymerase n=1 Tax=Micromonospora trifolii TaxID=2911208 RepID=A0ABS9MVQ9_9ACTN|nr:hypothetical protein [Micromonospora trifolii]MCG5441747.1 hypothetical protein [Micromonospora trifolii]